jgi:integrase
MASYHKRTNGDGSKAVIAWVRVKPFKTASRSFPTLSAAQEWADALEAELRKQRKTGDTRKDITSLTIKGLIEAYLADPEVMRLKYFSNLAQILSWWTNHCGGEKVLQFGTVKLREARELLSNGRAPGTVNRYLSGLRSCWNWGRAAQYIPSEKVWPTRLFRTEPRERVRFLNDSELSGVMQAAEAHSPGMHAAVVVSLATGLRRGELLRLEWKDIDFERKTVTVQLGKNTTGGAPKRRIVHLNEPAITAIKKLRRDGVIGHKAVFLNSDGEPADKNYLVTHWRTVRTAAKLVDFRWHDLRHSCASFLAQNGASLVEIGSVLGHSSPSITAKYAHLVAGMAVTGSAALAAKLSAKL